MKTQATDMPVLETYGENGRTAADQAEVGRGIALVDFPLPVYD